jgi:hypothetical protein
MEHPLCRTDASGLPRRLRPGGDREHVIEEKVAFDTEAER